MTKRAYVTGNPEFADLGKRPSGWVLAHNNVARAVNTQHGQRGFRCFWIDPNWTKWRLCECGWRPELDPHYASFLTTSACEDESMFDEPLPPTATLDLALARGDLQIRADQLPEITSAELRRWKISRVDLHRCFVEGAVLMHGLNPAEVRATAHRTFDNEWEVVLVRYSEHTRPKPEPEEAVH